MREREPTKKELERDQQQLELLRKEIAEQNARDTFKKATPPKEKPKQSDST